MTGHTGQSEQYPVITIDGPSGAGKGTAAAALADALSFHLLDSGAVYRVAALHAVRCKADLADEASVLATLPTMQAQFKPSGLDGVDVFLADENVSQEIRTEKAGNAASQVAIMPAVRSELLDEQRAFRQAPGLVADGRDMGTVVFPDAQLKVFLTASAEQRAFRRAKQLKDKGITANIAGLVDEISERDHRDASRTHSPLVPAEDAIVIESSDLSADEVVARILEAWHQVS
jgi:CMP/dCMP kinase